MWTGPIVAVSAGGSADLVPRVFYENCAEVGQSVLVETVRAGGNIGAEFV